jgi:glutaredoxin
MIMHYTIYSKDACSFCDRAKQLAESDDLQHTIIKLGRDIERDALLQAIQYYGHGRTMPMIVGEDEYGNRQLIGGFTEFNKHVKETRG